MLNWSQLVTAIVVSVFASSGFWMWVMKKTDKRCAADEMLLGLGHDRISYLCLKYLHRGWITPDELENLNDYLYVPYTKMKGNGTAKKYMEDVFKLKIRPASYIHQDPDEDL
jgi:hypothetical protein